MFSYHLVERAVADHRLVEVWDDPTGAVMAASVATELLLAIAADRPQLHEKGATTYLAVEPIGGVR